MRLLTCKTVLSMLFGVFSLSAAHAGSYDVLKITHVYTDASGNMSLKWQGAPDPGPCGSPNYGWVSVMPSADPNFKAFVYMLHANELPAQIVTSGCNGTREIVSAIYSPDG